MTTTTIPETRTAVSPHEKGEAAPPVAVPGRDLALFVLLLLATDFSGLLHIYGLSWLYGEPTFLGLGWTMVLVAAALLVLPARERPGALRFPLRRPVDGLVLLGGGVLLALAATFLYIALSDPPAWVARAPRDTILAGLLGMFAVQSAALAVVPALALVIVYVRDEVMRRVWIGLLAAALFLLSLVNLLYDAGVGHPAPATWAIVLGAGLPATLLLGGLIAGAGGLVLLRPARFLAVAIGAGLALRLIGIAAIPLTIRLGDMLPLLQMSTTRILQAQNPYIVYQMPWDLPLTYWPLTVLSYLPAALAGIDLRWVNLLFGPLVGALLLVAGGRRGPGPAAHAFGLLYLAPGMLQWDISTAAPPYWLWLCVAFATAVGAARARPGWLLPGAGVGAALAAAPLALPFAPFLGASWLAQGWRVALRRVVVAGVVFALLVGPFLLWGRRGFLDGAIGWFNDINRLPLLKWQTDKSWALEVGLAGPFWYNGLQDWLKPLQIVLVGGLGVILPALRLRPVRTPTAALRWGAAAYLLFMVVNPVIWPYLYVPALLALAFALVPAGDAAPPVDGALAPQ
jgi:hypothetical protein